jgi:cytochrome b
VSGRTETNALRCNSARTDGLARSDGPASSEPTWDGPTRWVHWSIAGLFVFSWWSARHHRLPYHRLSGYALLSLLLFRLYWGVVGSATSRFAHFVRGPRIVWRYLRGTYAPAGPGHNPLGALSVIALLGLLFSQVVLGLLSVDVDGLESGPLARLVSFDTGRACASAHGWVFNALLALVGLHLAAVIYHQFIRHQNLIGPMFHPQCGTWVGTTGVAWWRLMFGILIVVGVVSYVVVQ